jgi:hypothetical protein
MDVGDPERQEGGGLWMFLWLDTTLDSATLHS